MSSVLAGVDQSWHRVPVILRKLDAYPDGKLEAWSTVLLHNCIAYIPGMKRIVLAQLGISSAEDVLWRRGGHGEGDIVACTEADNRALGYIETKALNTQVSYGYRCPLRCGARLSQFEHMAHGAVPIIVVAPRLGLPARERRWRVVDGLPDDALVLSYSDVAALIEKALISGEPPRYPLVEALYDVEKVELAS